VPNTADLSRHNLYAAVTAQIVAALETSVITHDLPWHRQAGLPQNVLSKKPYRGVNAVLLWLAGQAQGYSCSSWGTFKQWRERGHCVRKGEKAATVVFWKSLGPQPDMDEEPGGAASLRAPMLARAYAVFNAGQVEGYTPPEITVLAESERDDQAERFFSALPIKVIHGSDMAYYAPVADRVHLPIFAAFHDAQSYYSVRAHESIHASGAKHRLDRDLSGRFGTEAYAMEELVAELGAAFVCATLGLEAEPRADHAGYIASWLRVLKSDTRAVFTAASKAQQAADWLAHAASPAPVSPAPAAALERPRGSILGRRSWVRRSGPGALYV
jgi:antirestriction protein ArdC